MAKGDMVPDAHTIARYCGAAKIAENGRPLNVAFRLEQKDVADQDPHLSVNWLEYFADKGRKEQISMVQEVISRKLRVGGKAKLALLNVREVRQKIQEIVEVADVKHWPTNDIGKDGGEVEDESHSGIFRIDTAIEFIATALSQIECEMEPAKPPQ